jgi:SAM-dependent methyltransferase
LLRFDIRYRRKRMHEALSELGLGTAGTRVLDFGFGAGDLLASFPSDCEIHGAEISVSALESASRDARFAAFKRASFSRVFEDAPESLPAGPFDFIVASHVLEHVFDDTTWAHALADRLAPGGALLVFLPIEEPGYNPDHERIYDVRSSAALLERAGLEVLHAEGGLHMNGHVWKLITYPSRRRWPVLGPAVNTLRLVSQTVIPYGATRRLEAWADSAGLGPRQAFVIGRKR